MLLRFLIISVFFFSSFLPNEPGLITQTEKVFFFKVIYAAIPVKIKETPSRKSWDAALFSAKVTLIFSAYNILGRLPHYSNFFSYKAVVRSQKCRPMK